MIFHCLTFADYSINTRSSYALGFQHSLRDLASVNEWKIMFHPYIRKTCPCNEYPLKPHFYLVKLGFAGVYLFFLIFAPKHRLWVLVRTASPRRFKRVPAIYVLSKNKKNIEIFLMKFSIFDFSDEIFNFYR